MELNDALLWMVGVSCVLTIVAALRAGPREMGGWVAAAAIALGAAGVCWVVRRDVAGYVGGVVWAMLVVVPGLGMRRVRRHLGRMHLAKAVRLASWLRVLHPFDGWWVIPTLLRAQLLEDRGDGEAARALLVPLTQRPDAVGRQATHHLLRAGRRWQEIIEWVDRLPAGTLRRDTSLLATYVRALGETGELMRMVWTFDRYRRVLEAPANAPARASARLAVLALGGRVGPVESLLASWLREMPAAVKAYWLGTAELAAGDGERGRGRLEGAIPAASSAVREAIRQRLDQPPRDARPFLAGGGDKVLARVDEEREHEDRYGIFSPRAARPVATYALLIANVAMYVVEVLRGGGTNVATLYRLGGADYVSVVLWHQWWRLLACTFLHYGPVHLTMNMLGLLVLGPFVERSLGRALYLTVYVFCGVAGAAGVVWLSARHPREQTLLMGASASIMGMVGGTAAILLAGLLRERARVAAQRLRGVLLVMALQVVFDYFTPRVSGSAHLFGMACGFVLVVPIRMVRGRGVRG